jgi:hypothetical protein
VILYFFNIRMECEKKFDGIFYSVYQYPSKLEKNDISFTFRYSFWLYSTCTVIIEKRKMKETGLANNCI